MQHTPRHRVVVAVALLVGLFGAGAAAREIIEQVVVKVNGEILTKTDLEAREVAALRQRGQMSDEELKKALAEIAPQILVDTVDEMLILQRGRDLGYRLGDDQFKDILDRIKKENKIETEDQFEAALKQEGLTLAELRKSLEKQMIVSRVQQNEVLGKISVSEAEAKKYYEAHKSELTSPTTMMIREILVAVPASGGTLNVGREDEAKAKAEALRARIVAGESFETLAGSVSDAPSKSNGGLIGPINAAEIDKNLKAVFEPLKTGDLTPIVRTARGYQFFKIEAKTEAQVMPYDQAREQISNRVANDKQRVEFMKFLVRIRTEALIEWKNAELKKLYDERVALDAAEAKKG